MRAVFLLTGFLATAWRATPTIAAEPSLRPLDPDADVVLVLPALDQESLVRQRDALGYFLRALGRERLTYALVSLSSVLQGSPASSLTAEDLRGYLRETFTWRASTETHPRYLGILAAPSPGYLGTPAVLPAIPRFHVNAGGAELDSDVPYEFLPPRSIDGGDGSVDPVDLDMTAPTFEVFRVPAGRTADLLTFGLRHDQFASFRYRNDVTLVAGEFGLFPGDTSVVQCLNANNLAQQQLAHHVYKLFDSTAAICAPDVLTRAGGPNLAAFLADHTGPFRGGTIVDVSHGSAVAIYAQDESGQSFSNLTTGDVARIPAGRLNVFVSIACDNDAPGLEPNLAATMYQRASVAVVSATTAVTPVSVADTLFAEVDSVTALFQQRENLAQRLHAFRSEYYRRFVLPAAADAQQELWINTLTVSLIGDGLVSVAMPARRSSAPQ